MSESALKKAREAEYTIMVFFSNFNERSVRTRVAIRAFIESHPLSGSINAREVDYENDREICLQYGVTGTPALFLFRKQELVSRHFGEITHEELAKLVGEVFESR
jgi:hypothetical protein